MMGLTIWQPHATLLASELRTIETRGWSTPYRGKLLIHAAKKWDSWIEEDCLLATLAINSDHMNALSEAARTVAATPWSETLGKVLAVADLVDCRAIPVPEGTPYDREFGGFGEGRYGWVLSNLRPLAEPIPCRGCQGLWDVPAAVLQQLEGVLT